MALPRCGLLAAAFLSITPVVCHAAGASGPNPPRSHAFEENRGQAPASIRFLARRGLMLVGIEDAAFTLSIPGGRWTRLSFAGASQTTAVRGEGRLPETRNYSSETIPPAGPRMYLRGMESESTTSIPESISCDLTSLNYGLGARAGREQLGFEKTYRPFVRLLAVVRRNGTGEVI